MRPERLISAQYQVLPHSIPFSVPGFLKHYRLGNMTFSPGQITCEKWFDDFVDRVLASTGSSYLPICRMSDGEFTVLLGEQPWHLRHPFPERFRLWAGFAYRKLLVRRFDAATWAGVSSGSYDYREIKRFRQQYSDAIILLAEKGMLALHLSYGPWPFQEQYFPALIKWLSNQQLELSFNNYVPFYFVYALLTGPRRSELLNGRRVLLINGANSAKQSRIETSLRNEGVLDVFWCPISPSRSFYDMIDTSLWLGKVDLVLVGAGVGKPNVLLQLEPLGVPAIDAGFVFEVWANPEMRWHRPMCVPDEAYDIEKVRFLPRDFKK